MKPIMILMFLCIGAFTNEANAQAQEAEQLLLNVQKLAQLKQILKDMKTGFQIVSQGYSSLRDISKGNFGLHKTFLDGLMAVSPAVKNCRKIKDIINFEMLIVKEYKPAFRRFKQDKNFSPDEIDYIAKVYSNLFQQSLKNLDKLASIITANQLRMSDDERLAAIDHLYEDMQDKLSFLKGFNNNTSILGIQRARQKADANTLRTVYGLNN